MASDWQQEIKDELAAFLEGGPAQVAYKIPRSAMRGNMPERIDFILRHLEGIGYRLHTFVPPGFGSNDFVAILERSP